MKTSKLEPKYDERSALAVVLGEGTNFINGRLRGRKQKYQIRDVSKLKWAPNCIAEENKEKKEEVKTRKKDISSLQKGFGYNGEDLLNAQSIDDLNEFGSDFDGDLNVRELTVEELIDSMMLFNLGSFANSKASEEFFNKQSMYKLYGKGFHGKGGMENAMFGGNTDIDPVQLRKHIFKQLSEQEKKQLTKWMSSLRNMILTNEELQHLKYNNEMENYCDVIFEQMKTPLSNFAHCIIGPKYSGKSTFLSVLISKIGERLAINRHWKNTFIFFLGFKSISKNLDSLVGLYQAFISNTFFQAELQIPKLAPYAKKIAEFFSKVVTNEMPPVFPKRITIDKKFNFADIKLTKLAEKSKKVFNFPEKYKEAIEFIFNFPREIATIFGMTEIHYILDDFDACDVDIPYRKTKYHKQESPIILIEELKQLLPTVSFILCCQNLPHFLDILDSINKKTVDLKTKVQFVNISDLPIDPPESKFEILIQYKNQASLRINRDNCQGCIGFIVGWDKLVKLGQVCENNLKLQSTIKLRTQKTIDLTEDDVKIIEYTQNFLPKILSHDDLPASQISYVSLVDPKS